VAGFKNFVAGEILTASDVNSFVGNQVVAVFDNATDRDSAIVSPVHGQFVFRTDDEVLEFFDGEEFREL
jgi:hypothetical protein